MSILDRVLDRSGLYELSRRAIGARREMEGLLELAKPAPGEAVLDFGCGNGRLLAHLPAGMSYVGVDNNPSYIDDAAARLGSPTARFVCGDLLHLGELGLAPVDLVISIGVLHHIDDDVAEAAVRSALGMLVAGGRMLTMDPVFEPGQHSIARVLMAMDRGKYVRHPNDYRRLVERAGGVVQEQHIWSHVYRFPYTHCVQVVRPAEV